MTSNSQGTFGVDSKQCSVLSLCMLKEDYALRFWAKVTKTPSCWLWTGRKDPRDYGYYGHGASTSPVGQTRAHRIAYCLHYDCFLDSTDVLLHSCDNPSCINPNHLRIGSQSANLKDMHSKGRGVGGPNLTKVEVTYLKERYAQGDITVEKLAKEFGRSYNAVGGVISGRTYKQWR